MRADTGNDDRRADLVVNPVRAGGGTCIRFLAEAAWGVSIVRPDLVPKAPLLTMAGSC